MSEPRYREYALEPPLDALVECVWFLAQDARSGAAPDVQRIPPDGCVEIIFHLGERFDQLANGRRRPQPGAMVIGVWTQPIAIVPPGRFDTVGVRIRPGCASAFSAEPMDRFTDTVTDATAVWGRAIAAVRDRLGDARGDAGRVAIVSEFLVSRLRQRDPAVAAAIARILSTRGRQSIDALARAAGVNHRRLERAFRAHVGVPAKTLSRIVRFQHVLRHSTPDTAGAWADVAATCGYADQSHLIRDFAQFTGTTPVQLAAAEPELADYFRRR
jgi:AraC-like DNA-binding protein